MKIGSTVEVIKITDLSDAKEVKHTIGMRGKVYAKQMNLCMVEFDTKECYCYSTFELEEVV